MTLIDRMRDVLERIEEPLINEFTWNLVPILPKKRITSSECELFFRDKLDMIFYYDKMKNPSLEEKCFGSVLKREEENPDYYNMYDLILEEYREFFVLKYTGLTIVEFLNLTNYDKLKILEFTKECIVADQKLNEEARAMAEGKSDRNIQNMRNEFNKVSNVQPPPTNAAGLDNLEELFGMN